MAEQFRGIPPDEITTHNNTRRVEQSWANRPHEDLVKAFRGLIQQERLALGKDAWLKPPVAVVSDALSRESRRDYPLQTQRREYFRQMRLAWDVIAHDSFQFEQLPEAFDSRIDMGTMLHGAYQIAEDQQAPRPELIKLDPLQAKVLDAMAEAADIPHQKGQTEITIPEQFRSEKGLANWYRHLSESRRK